MNEEPKTIPVHSRGLWIGLFMFLEFLCGCVVLGWVLSALLRALGLL